MASKRLSTGFLKSSLLWDSQGDHCEEPTNEPLRAMRMNFEIHEKSMKSNKLQPHPEKAGWSQECPFKFCMPQGSPSESHAAYSGLKLLM